MRKTLALSVFLLTAIVLTPIQAKWATLADAPTKNSYTEEINVNADGTFTIITEINREILTEIGRNQDANITLYYKDDCEKTEVLEAKAIFQGKEYKLKKNQIEDKPLASSFKGFDQTRQILLAFPKTEIGAKLYLKYKTTVKKPNLDNFFANTFYFGRWEFVTNHTVKINSKLPLHILVNDPDHSLKVAENKTKDHYTLEITLTKPIYKIVANEPDPIIIDNKYFSWVSVSSLDKWEDLAAKHGKLLTKVFTQKLPTDFEQILNVAKQKTNEIDQINTVTSLLNDKIRYMGDWRSIGGRFIPRDLEVISKTQLGDCKDFAASTAAILTKLGYKAQIVAVMRGINNLSPRILPSFEAANHAMVKVTNKQGKIYWIDPTNFQSMANGIFPDIASKMALILDPQQPGYEKIPAVNHVSAESNLKRVWEILNNTKIIESGSMLMKNETTLGLTGATLKVSADLIKNYIFYMLADRVTLDEKTKKSMELPQLNSRLVKDIALNYSFERENDILRTNAGPALKLTCASPIATIYNISQDYASEALITDSPETIKKQTLIKNINVKNIESLNKEMKTPWLYVKRECSMTQNKDLQIDDTLIIYKNLIPSEDFKKPEFVALKNWLKDNFKDVIIVFEPKQK